MAAFDWSLARGRAHAPVRSAAARALGGNAMADALPLFEALASRAEAARARAAAVALARAGACRRCAPVARRRACGAMDAWRAARIARHDVVILGGGLAGLTLALQLKQRFADLDVLVLERRVAPGAGAAHKVGESTVEIGAHYFERRCSA